MKMSNKITDDEKKQKRIAYLGNDKKHDIHEKDKKHLADTLRSYIEFGKKHPEEFRIVECTDGENMLSPESISKQILTLVEEKI